MGGSHRGEREAVQRTGGVGQSRGALSLEVRHEHQSAAARRRTQGEVGEGRVVDAEQPGAGVQHPRGVERGDERQEAAGGIREPGDRAGRVGALLSGDPAGDARRADAQDDVADLDLQAQGGRHVVAGAGSDQRSRRELPRLAGRLARTEHPRQHRAVTEGELDEVVAVGVRARIEPAGPARVSAVGGEGVQSRRSEQPPAQPVVWQAHGRRARGVLRLVLGHPAGLGRGERRDRDGSDRLGPRARTAQLGDQAAAWGADRLSFQSSAGRTTSPPSSSET